MSITLGRLYTSAPDLLEALVAEINTLKGAGIGRDSRTWAEDRRRLRDLYKLALRAHAAGNASLCGRTVRTMIATVRPYSALYGRTLRIASLAPERDPYGIRGDHGPLRLHVEVGPVDNAKVARRAAKAAPVGIGVQVPLI